MQQPNTGNEDPYIFFNILLVYKYYYNKKWKHLNIELKNYLKYRSNILFKIHKIKTNKTIDSTIDIKTNMA